MNPQLLPTTLSLPPRYVPGDGIGYITQKAMLFSGDIIEQGTHEQLLAKGSFYADLCNSQFEKAS